MPETKKNERLEKIISFTPPKLYTGKSKKDWYIGFYAFDPALNKRRLKRIKVNHIEKISDRRKYCNDLIIRITEELRKGFNPWIDSSNSKSYTSFLEACDVYERETTRYFKDGLLREDTYIGYMSYLRNLKRYNEKRKLPINYIYQLDNEFANDFLDHIYFDRNNCAQTRDNYLGWLRLFASFLLGRRFLKSKFTEGVYVLGKRKRRKQRTVIEPDDMLKLKDLLEKVSKPYLLACYILFYCFIRPKEMSKIQIKHISLINQTLFIPGENSKNKTAGTITLPAKLIHLMIDLKVFDHPSNYFLFSDQFMPGKEYKTEKQFRDFWLRNVRNKLKFPDSYKFYSLKDTGVTMMLRNRVDNLSVRDQARHSSILITDTYTPHDIQEANKLLSNYDTVF